MQNTVVRIQNKGSRFVLLTNEDYENKVEHQIPRSSFKELPSDPSQEFERKVKLWIDKWQSNKTLSNDWVKFITPEHSKPGKMYGNIRTHKINNPVRVITSGCSTAVESLSIFVEKELYKLAENLPSRIKDTNDMLNIIDNLNNNCIPENAFLISFDVVNMFPSIHNESGIKSVERLLNTRCTLNPPTLCILEALRLCLECNNSVFNNKFYLQTDGTTQGPNMSCSYSDIAMAVYDEKAMDHPFKPLIWKRFRDDVIALWIHSNEDANHYLDYLKTIDASGKIRFTMETATENELEFLALRLKLKGCNKITVDVYSKSTNSFTYIDPKTCYPSRNMNKIPESIALRLRYL